MTLKDWSQKSEDKIIFCNPISLSELISELEKKYGNMPIQHQNLTILVNGKIAKMDTVLQNSDVVVLSPILVGG